MVRALTQFSVFLVDKPGILSRVCDALAEKKINLTALTLMDSVEHGVFRLVAEDVDKTREALQSLNIPLKVFVPTRSSTAAPSLSWVCESVSSASNPAWPTIGAMSVASPPSDDKIFSWGTVVVITFNVTLASSASVMAARSSIVSGPAVWTIWRSASTIQMCHRRKGVCYFPLPLIGRRDDSLV